ncbi:FadR family transcriptional regulator [bacterium]|nr:FadR family transcriptional regulator [bacterium]
MQELLKPIRAESLKEVFVTRFEELILSGKLSIGEKLPSERELAFQLGVSRPVVHEGLVELASKGLITMKPRAGAIVNDYRKSGSPDILNSLFNYHQGKLDLKILDSILSMRMLFEVETARLAALNRSEDQVKTFNNLIRRENKVRHTDIQALIEVDFEFHHLITLASDNQIYPLLMNSMKSIYTNLTGQFFADPAVVPRVFTFHREMVDAIGAKDEIVAVRVMKKILKHGEKQFILLINGRK